MAGGVARDGREWSILTGKEVLKFSEHDERTGAVAFSGPLPANAGDQP
jgi:hypothetical protein